MEAGPGLAIHFATGTGQPLGSGFSFRSDALVRAIVAWSCCLLLMTAPVTAQVDHAAELRASAHAAIEPGLVANEQERLVLPLLASDAGAAALLLAVRGELDPALRRYQKDRDRHLDRFGKAAVETLRQRRGRTGNERIETLRKEVVVHSRDPDLDKETIHRDLDPRLEELSRLFVVTVQDVRDGDAEVAAEGVRLRAVVERLITLFVLSERIEGVLLKSKNGANFLRAHALAGDPREFLAELDEREKELAAAATPLEARDAKVIARNLEAAAELDSEESRGIAELNRIRMLLGIGALSIDVKLCAAARDHATDMVKLGFFAHVSPVEGKHSFGERAARFGASASAENIAAGQRTGSDAIAAWWYSPGHHRNMLSGAARVGLGRCETTWTQMFGG